jgi:hypothetical protein
MLTHFGGAEQILKTPAAKLVHVPRLGEKRVSAWAFLPHCYVPKKN